MCIFIVVNTYMYISIKNRVVTGQENQKKDAFDLCPSTRLEETLFKPCPRSFLGTGRRSWRSPIKKSRSVL
jgi:hypothetical protein